ncbi:MAG: TOBE domain-containing protein, partial [Ruoffia tabacinasalis]
SPQMNMIHGKIIKENDIIYFRTVENKIRLPHEIVDRLTVEATGQDVLLGIRPENINYADNLEESNVIIAKAKNVEQVGSDTFVYFDLQATARESAARFNPPRMIPLGADIPLTMDLTKVMLFDKSNKRAILTPRSLEGVF